MNQPVYSTNNNQNILINNSVSVTMGNRSNFNNMPINSTNNKDKDNNNSQNPNYMPMMNDMPSMSSNNFIPNPNPVTSNSNINNNMFIYNNNDKMDMEMVNSNSCKTLNESKIPKKSKSNKKGPKPKSKVGDKERKTNINHTKIVKVGKKTGDRINKVKKNNLEDHQVYLHKDIKKEVSNILYGILNDNNNEKSSIKKEDEDVESGEENSFNQYNQNMERDPDEIVFKDENDRLKFINEFNRKYNINQNTSNNNNYKYEGNYLNKITKEAYSSVFLDHQIIKKRNTPINKLEFKDLISECVQRNAPPIILKCIISKVDNGKMEPYKCPYPNCNEIFSKTHFAECHNSNTDSSVRPFICQICEKTFRRRFDLTRHSNSHNAIKPYHCSRCLRGFARSDSCLRHIRMTKCQPFNFKSIPNDNIDLFKLFSTNHSNDSTNYVTVTPSITKDSFILLTFHQLNKERNNSESQEILQATSQNSNKQINYNFHNVKKERKNTQILTPKSTPKSTVNSKPSVTPLSPASP
jgi:hypothetical protein